MQVHLFHVNLNDLPFYRSDIYQVQITPLSRQSQELSVQKLILMIYTRFNTTYARQHLVCPLSPWH